MGSSGGVLQSVAPSSRMTRKRLLMRPPSAESSVRKCGTFRQNHAKKSVAPSGSLESKEKQARQLAHHSASGAAGQPATAACQPSQATCKVISQLASPSSQPSQPASGLACSSPTSCSWRNGRQPGQPARWLADRQADQLAKLAFRRPSTLQRQNGPAKDSPESNGFP